jgi:hypothetical protein
MKMILGLAAAAFMFSTAPAIAQSLPGGVPIGAGVQRGVMELNNSGQNGFVTLFDHGATTHVVTQLKGTTPGRVQLVAVQRGKMCNAVTPGIVARSADMHSGMSRGDVMMEQSRLLSGNYVIVVYSSNVPGMRMVACGRLFK